jgi:hypothetical protein
MSSDLAIVATLVERQKYIFARTSFAQCPSEPIRACMIKTSHIYNRYM